MLSAAAVVVNDQQPEDGRVRLEFSINREFNMALTTYPNIEELSQELIKLLTDCGDFDINRFTSLLSHPLCGAGLLVSNATYSPPTLAFDISTTYIVSQAVVDLLKPQPHSMILDPTTEELVEVTTIITIPVLFDSIKKSRVNIHCNALQTVRKMMVKWHSMIVEFVAQPGIYVCRFVKNQLFRACEYHLMNLILLNHMVIGTSCDGIQSEEFKTVNTYRHLLTAHFHSQLNKVFRRRSADALKHAVTRKAEKVKAQAGCIKYINRKNIRTNENRKRQARFHRNQSEYNNDGW